MPFDHGYRTAFADWLACAARGAREPAARAAAAAGDSLPERVAAAGTAGHVLDFDDTYLPGLAHLSAAAAPAALLVGADRGLAVGEVLPAFAAGFEAMGALARGCHPALYDGGLHPTAVCGPWGAAAATSALLGLEPARRRAAAAISLLRAAGLRSAFGSAGKSLQVGLAAAAGVEAARLAEAGVALDLERVARGPGGFEQVFGGVVPEPVLERADAVAENWIKPWPCCLQTQGAIEAALRLREADEVGPAAPLEVLVHPVSLQAAPITDPADGLEAKFSIPYLTAFALLRGAPTVESFARIDSEVRERAARVAVFADPALAESEAVLRVAGKEAARVEAAPGSPSRPLAEEELRSKRERLAGDRLEGALDDPGLPAAELAAAVGLR